MTTAQAKSIFKSVTSQADSGNQKKALAATQGVSWHEQTFDFFALKHSEKYTYGKPSFIIPRESVYPQWFAVTTKITAPKDAPSSLAGVSRPASGPALMTFEKMNPQAPWQLSTTMRLQPGQQLPKVSPAPDIAQLDDTSSYLVRPDLVGPLQASVVDDGPKAPAASAVKSGPLTTGMYSYENGIKPVAGDKRMWSLEGATYDRFALRLANGGALVFYSDALNETEETPSELNLANPVTPGKVIPVPGPFKVLIPSHESKPTDKLETDYDLDFAAIDPPASAKNAKIQVITMGGVPTSADAHS
ncbi:MAG: hypothetical protein FWE35_04120 [Streptosporangiales bacterium]|nr:hypothetical protein [Streptosporangiales bacterium]